MKKNCAVRSGLRPLLAKTDRVPAVFSLRRAVKCGSTGRDGSCRSAGVTVCTDITGGIDIRRWAFFSAVKPWTRITVCHRTAGPRSRPHPCRTLSQSSLPCFTLPAPDKCEQCAVADKPLCCQRCISDLPVTGSSAPLRLINAAYRQAASLPAGIPCTHADFIQRVIPWLTEYRIIRGDCQQAGNGIHLNPRSVAGGINIFWLRRNGTAGDTGMLDANRIAFRLLPDPVC